MRLVFKGVVCGLIISGLYAHFFDSVGSGTEIWSLYVGIVLGVWIGYCSLVYEWINKRLLDMELALNKANMVLLQTQYYRDVVAKREADEFKKLLGSTLSIKKSVVAL